MTTIALLRADFFRVPLPITLTDSTHGEMKHFELIEICGTALANRASNR